MRKEQSATPAVKILLLFISKNGDIGGFAYGSDIKQKLLNLENGAVMI